MLGSGPSMENSWKLILVLAFLVPALPVAAQQTDPDVIWKGDFEAGPSSLSGHCSPRGDREREIGSSVGSAHPPVLALFVLDQRR